VNFIHPQKCFLKDMLFGVRVGPFLKTTKGGKYEEERVWMFGCGGFVFKLSFPAG
jgi:hypothetical protein